MNNYQRVLPEARRLFLKWNQQKMIERYGLRYDDEYIYIDFLSEAFRIHRKSAVVTCLSAPDQPAGFFEALAIYDYLCRDNALTALSGRFCRVNALRCAAQSSPNTSALHQKWAERFQDHFPALQKAVEEVGFAAFPQGDAACMLSVFNGFPIVFQFWLGDEEFPPSVSFLWDENTPDYLKYETTYYVMDCVLERLNKKIETIEGNC